MNTYYFIRHSPPPVDGMVEFDGVEGVSSAGETSDSSLYYSGYGVASQGYVYPGAENPLGISYATQTRNYAEYSSGDTYPSAGYVTSAEGGYGVDGVFASTTRPSDGQYYSTAYAIPQRSQAYGDPRGYVEAIGSKTSLLIE